MSDEFPRPALKISLIGGAHFSYGGQDVRIANRRALAILGYLALSDTHVERRERLAFLFWSNADAIHSSGNLRQAIHEIQVAMKRVGCDAFVASRLTLSLSHRGFDLDVETVTRAIAAGEVPDALLRQEGTAMSLLAGLDDLDSVFHAWLLARRQSLHDSWVHGLEDGYRDERLPIWRRRRLAEAVLQLDVTHEEACRMVMRSAAMAGETAAALEAYNRLYRRLDSEHDSEPSDETTALVADIKLGNLRVAGTEPIPVGHGPGGAAELVAKPVIFVPPFGRNGVSAGQEHLVDGFRSELMASLARFRDWYVSGLDPSQATDRYNAAGTAGYVAHVSVYQAGATINTILLVRDAASDVVLSSERFELTLENWFTSLQTVVAKIAAGLNVHISWARLSRLANMPEVSWEAHDVWLRGQAVVRDYDANHWLLSEEWLTHAMLKAPGFSPLYSTLAQLYNGLPIVLPGEPRTRNRMERAVTLAREAVKLDPYDSRAALCLGWALAFAGLYDQAGWHMEAARMLNENDPWTQMSVAMFHAFNGNLERAGELAEHSMGLTLFPTPSHWVYQTSISYLLGDYKNAIAAADHAGGTLPTVHLWRAVASQHLGDNDRARDDVDRFYDAVRARWPGDIRPTPAMMGKWFLDIFPIGRRGTWEQLRDDVARLGVPVAEVSRHG